MFQFLRRVEPFSRHNDLLRQLDMFAVVAARNVTAQPKGSSAGGGVSRARLHLLERVLLALRKKLSGGRRATVMGAGPAGEVSKQGTSTSRAGVKRGLAILLLKVVQLSTGIAV